MLVHEYQFSLYFGYRINTKHGKKMNIHAYLNAILWYRLSLQIECFYA